MVTVMHLFLYLHKNMLDKHLSLTSTVFLLPFTAPLRLPALSRLFPALHHTKKSHCTPHVPGPWCLLADPLCTRCVLHQNLLLQPISQALGHCLLESPGHFCTPTSASITVASFPVGTSTCLSLDFKTASIVFSTTEAQTRLQETYRGFGPLITSNLKKDHGTGHGFWLPQQLPRGIRWCYFL